MDEAIETCTTGMITEKYTLLANGYTQELSQALVKPMFAIFVSLVGLWAVIEFARLIRNKITLYDILDELLFVILAAVLLSGQGPELVNQAYNVVLSTMGSVANVALQVGNQSDSGAAAVNGVVPLHEGMKALVCSAEKGVGKVIGMASYLAQTASLTDPMPWLYSLALVIPYFLVMVVYFSQVVVSIFRVIMVTTFSPLLIMAFGFGWGREMTKSGIKAIIATFIVLFGATAAVSIMLYGVNSLDIGDVPTKESVREMASMQNPKFLLILALGWLGTAFMTEATGIANTIANSSLTNTAVGVITAGAATTASTLAKPVLERAGNFKHNASKAVGDLIAQMKK